MLITVNWSFVVDGHAGGLGCTDFECVCETCKIAKPELHVVGGSLGTDGAKLYQMYVRSNVTGMAVAPNGTIWIVGTRNDIRQLE